MGWFDSNTVKDIGRAFDDNLTSDEERLELTNELAKAKMQFGGIVEKAVTNRWESDNKIGSKFAKLIRPMLVTYLVLIATTLALLDGNIAGFTIKSVWVDLFSNLAFLSVTAYFGLRTYEKRTGTSVWKN